MSTRFWKIWVCGLLARAPILCGVTAHSSRANLGREYGFTTFLVYRSESNSPLRAEGRVFFEQAFYAIWSARVEDDSYNALVLNSGLSWRQAALLRALGAYLKQIRFDYSQGFIAETLSSHPKISSDLVELFTALFQPNNGINVWQRKFGLESSKQSMACLIFLRTVCCALISVLSMRC